LRRARVRGEQAPKGGDDLLSSSTRDGRRGGNNQLVLESAACARDGGRSVDARSRDGRSSGFAVSRAPPSPLSRAAGLVYGSVNSQLCLLSTATRATADGVARADSDPPHVDDCAGLD